MLPDEAQPAAHRFPCRSQQPLSHCPMAARKEGVSRSRLLELNRMCDCKTEVHRDRLNANFSSQVKKAFRVGVKNPLRDAVPRSFIIPEALTNTHLMNLFLPYLHLPTIRILLEKYPEGLPHVLQQEIRG